jgi:hypothetical protein
MTNRTRRLIAFRQVALAMASFAFVSTALAAPQTDPDAQAVAEASLAFLSYDCQHLGGSVAIGPHETSSVGLHGGAIGICSYGDDGTLVATVDVDRLAMSIKTVIVVDGRVPQAFQKPTFEIGLAERLHASGYAATDASVTRPQPEVIEIAVTGPMVRKLFYDRRFIRDPLPLQGKSSRLLDT